ncbi:metal ABC transporter solute-binding protein, Zn/Mn family [Alicyclobacillus dauci]|uniref:Zinc ABC transporter substrate-binding protein n=1 Tax=Alicyclobacillus dauci TaxID=1475485 RepID=A0ABY6YYY6_9BACL|nr:zinc ABC transporter substrate-binding protein [Alicyclobacillus dauci]WAH35791.1 zinc ABC transporter substrate-binding protein [Alicyclobacillus dauci]
MKLRIARISTVTLGLLVTSGLAVGCTTNTANGSGSPETKTTNGAKVIQAVGAESEYADVIKQIGGKYVSVTGIMSDPATDPHEYEASTKNASVISGATLVVQNGIGYDDFMNKLESASPNSPRTVIDVAKELGYGQDTQNPHLWYKTDTMPRVAELIAEQLEKQDPSQKQYFENNLTKFTDSLNTWKKELADLQSKYAGTGVAVTEPVADYLIQAAGLDVKTPWSFQEAIMNGTDPSPQDVQLQTDLFNQHKIKVFCYNQQVITDVTKTFLALAKKDHIPTVGVYETMPANHTYQTWMEDETKAITNALENGTSTETIS